MSHKSKNNSNEENYADSEEVKKMIDRLAKLPKSKAHGNLYSCSDLIYGIEEKNKNE